MPKFVTPLDLIQYVAKNYATFTDSELEKAFEEAIDALADDLGPLKGDYDPTPEAAIVYDELGDIIEDRESPDEEDDDDEDEVEADEEIENEDEDEDEEEDDSSDDEELDEDDL